MRWVTALPSAIQGAGAPGEPVECRLQGTAPRGPCTEGQRGALSTPSPFRCTAILKISKLKAQTVKAKTHEFRRCLCHPGASWLGTNTFKCFNGNHNNKHVEGPPNACMAAKDAEANTPGNCSGNKKKGFRQYECLPPLLLCFVLHEMILMSSFYQVLRMYQALS